MLGSAHDQASKRKTLARKIFMGTSKALFLKNLIWSLPQGYPAYDLLMSRQTSLPENGKLGHVPAVFVSRWHWLSLVTCYHWRLPSTRLKSKDKTMTRVKRVFMKRHTKEWSSLVGYFKRNCYSCGESCQCFPLWLYIFCVVADVWGSWAGLLLLEMWRSDTELAEGAKEQLGETGYCLQL